MKFDGSDEQYKFVEHFYSKERNSLNREFGKQWQRNLWKLVYLDYKVGYERNPIKFVTTLSLYILAGMALL